VYSAINSEAFSSRSGGIKGRPTALYISSNSGEKLLQRRIGQLLDAYERMLQGHPFSASNTTNIARCRRSSPRIRHFLLHHLDYSPRRITTKRNSWVYQHPARR